MMRLCIYLCTTSSHTLTVVSIKVINKVRDLFMKEGWLFKCHDHKSHRRQMQVLCVTWYSYTLLFIILFIVAPSRIAWDELSFLAFPFPLSNALSFHLQTSLLFFFAFCIDSYTSLMFFFIQRNATVCISYTASVYYYCLFSSLFPLQ